jgi:hypothetical protein
VIAKQSREGWFRSRNAAGFRFGTTPALRATPPDSGGEVRFPLLNLKHAAFGHFARSQTAPTGEERDLSLCKGAQRAGKSHLVSENFLQ